VSRIIGGAGKGRRLESPRGVSTRPTASRVRQTLFDILAPRISGCRFLDVFAGGGGVGLESLSRGAAHVCFVESSPEAVAVLKRNLALLDASRADVHCQDALVALLALARLGRRFDVVYLDPPYAGDLYEAVLERVDRGGLLDPEGVLVAEHFHKRVLPETIGTLSRYRAARVGDHRLSLYRSSGRIAAPGAGRGD
jgi:16S rRNA (guanine966-N2)-methyltransferase